MGNQPTIPPTDENDLRAYVQAVLPAKWIISGFVLFVMAITALVSYVAVSNQYEAATSVHLPISDLLDRGANPDINMFALEVANGSEVITALTEQGYGDVGFTVRLVDDETLEMTASASTAKLVYDTAVAWHTAFKNEFTREVQAQNTERLQALTATSEELNSNALNAEERLRAFDRATITYPSPERAVLEAYLTGDLKPRLRQILNNDVPIDVERERFLTKALASEPEFLKSGDLVLLNPAVVDLKTDLRHTTLRLARLDREARFISSEITEIRSEILRLLENGLEREGLAQTATSSLGQSNDADAALSEFLVQATAAGAKPILKVSIAPTFPSESASPAPLKVVGLAGAIALAMAMVVVYLVAWYRRPLAGTEEMGRGAP